MSPVTVIETKYVRGWPRHEIGGAVEVVDLADALEREYATDAHFAAYAAPNGRRLCGEALDRGIAVPMTACVFDLDCAEVHGTPAPVPAAWRRDVRERVHALASDHPDPWVYDTRGGARIVYLQREPDILRSRADALRWSQDYAIVCAYFARRYGLEADPACQDWTRLYRLPRATRDPGGSPENRPVSWLPGAPMGTLYVRATHDDMARARELTKAFRDPRAPRIGPITPCPGDGRGLLYHALSARGDIVRRHGESAYVVRCPAEREHTSGATGDGSTLLYPPDRGEEVGAIHCLHQHCITRTVRDWLACFGAAEIDAARDAAGLRRRTRP